MSDRPWIKADRREPPVSTETSRLWLELYIPERVQASPINDQTRGFALGLYLGSGNFRLAGSATNTLEVVRSWRTLAGSSNPVSERLRTYRAA